MNSPEIKSWTHKDDLPKAESPFIIDSVTRFKCFWRRAEIRNNSPHLMRYRFRPESRYEEIPSASERALQGWGSYLEIVAGVGPLSELPSDGVVIFEMVPMEDAYEHRS